LSEALFVQKSEKHNTEKIFESNRGKICSTAPAFGKINSKWKSKSYFRITRKIGKVSARLERFGQDLKGF
jgi:hypothetical protein